MSNFEKVPVGILNKVENNKQIFIAEFKDKLQEVFPSAVKDGIVDFEALLNEFGKYAETDEKEKYNMTWVGKKEAIKTANEDIIGKTLKYVPEDSKNPETTQNLYIEGDNLEVLKLLKNSYYGKIKMIYIDPPYNTGNDFIYNDKFKMDKEEYEKLEGSIDEYNERLTASKKGSGRYHSDWMNMMYPRLKVAKDLLKDDGVIFISIDDNEVDNLKKICDEILGEDNIVAILPTVMNLKGNNDQFGFAGTHEYTLVYCKSKNICEFGYLPIDDEKMNEWEYDEYGAFKKGANLKATGVNAPREKRPNLFFPLYISKDNKLYLDRNSKHDVEVLPITDGKEMSWRWSKNKFINEYYNIIINENDGKFSIYKKTRPLDGERPSQKPKTLFYKPEYSSGNGTNEIKQLFEGEKLFSNPKPTNLIIDFLRIVSFNEKEDIILDFFSGSGTTAHATMQLNSEDNGNRKFIMVQLPEICDEKSEAYKNGYKTICDIGRKRIDLAGEKIKEENKDKEGVENLDIGFKVFRVSDTNIRWISDAIKSNDGVEEKDIITQEELRENESYKDRLDFNPWFTDLDVVYEMMLKRQDIELTERIEKLSYIGDRTYLVGYTILVCLEENITEEMVRKISEIETSLSWIVFRDSAFDDDINLKTNTINLLRTLIKEKNPKNKNQKILWI
ncbi:site-specific DNA-methyltransferase [Clostridium perfringens]|uniref:Site-specific DNA-methyltransferase n=2 Tax=Clostridium perfringens TaxID=1502 RepID=A0AAW9KE43_CLOPF|nr:site-specific DNA-methyltransferase [Clostridium perfringens]MDV5115992.1 site-specific DNA-methyltransferase [Clostridium perfringens]MDZ7541607.1 site-specific DNA-methyltransferase [Clostridium perfringens]HAT4210753.1 site-specific DNA-methyltransferase [Clostridium perfringens]